MDACYIARRNSINSTSRERLYDCVQTYFQLRTIFLDAGIRTTVSIPRQHALKHIYDAIRLFGSPNGLCSSITESKHIEAVKRPWRRSSRFLALIQMLRILQRMDKMMALYRYLKYRRFLQGFGWEADLADSSNDATDVPIDDLEEHEDEDEAAVSGESQDVSEFDVEFPTRPRACKVFLEDPTTHLLDLSESGYPSQLHPLAVHIKQPKFPLAFAQFLYKISHPTEQIAPSTLAECPAFDGTIKVYCSAMATFYAPSDLSGSGGRRSELIRSTPSFFGHPRRDTVFVVTDNSQPGMQGMEIGRVQLFFSFEYRRKSYSCALINWFVHGDERDPDTGMWVVTPELDRHGEATLEVIQVDCIARAAHLVPVYGNSRVPEDFDFHNALDSYRSYFVNHFVDHHAHEFIGTC